MSNVRIYLAQRISALIMAPLVLAHIALMIYAARNGLTAEEILGRTRGSYWWAAFYYTFVIAAAAHASIGLRVIIQETFDIRGWLPELMTWVILLTLSMLGGLAVHAVTFA